jgi:hypothetical protein
MAENLGSFGAGQALLSLLQQQGLPNEVVQKITQLTAELVEEARLKGRIGSSVDPTSELITPLLSTGLSNR